MKKTALMLVCCLLLQSFALLSCSDKGTNEDASDVSSDAQTAEQVAEVIEEEEPDIYEEGLAAIANDSFAGRDFSILTRETELYEIDAEDITGEATNDAIYSRNLTVEEMYDINLVVYTGAMHDDVTQLFSQSVLANDMLYTLCAQKDYKASELVAKDMCGNWLDIPSMNLADGPWWTQLANDESTINNRLYAITGDYCITNMLYLYVLFYNADVSSQYGINAEDLQNMVFEGTWTIDAFNSLVKDLYVDSNGDTVRDEGDFYGVTLAGDATLDAWLTAFDQSLLEVGSDGSLNVVLLTEKTTEALDKIYSLYNENQGTYNVGNWKTDVAATEFLGGHGIFTVGPLENARTSYADVDFNLGMLPYPKWNEEQANYYSLASDCFSVLIFPVNVPEEDYAFLGTITEALSIVTSRDVAPVFFDSALKGRYSMDKNTADIVDIVMKGRRFDFAIQYGNQLQIAYMFRNEVLNKTKKIASTLASQEKVIKKNLELIGRYYGMDE